ncbi:MAG: TrkH family potassium uptake protein, partial [Candidatus Electryonea clarkiae]|nr:TrkH family potassium uptake protein [Candidatus Electryonea clarkiae]
KRSLNPRAVIRILGLILIMLGASMFLALFVSLIYRDGDSLGISISAFVSIIFGFIMIKGAGKEMDLSTRDGFAVVTFGWMIMGIAGALPYLFTNSIPNITNALFESVSGFTTTGASILTDIESLPHGILFWRSFTHWIGGMGIIVFSIAILPFLGVGGMQMFKAESPGPTADKLTPRIKSTAEILWGVYVLITILEIILLMLGGMDWFDSTCHAFGTLATGGFSTKNASIAHYSSPYIQYVITFFMVVAGVNFSLHYYALRGKFNRYWNSREFRFYIWLILGCIVIVTIFRLFDGIGLEQSFREGAFQVAAIISTTGYATADFELWHPLAQVILVGLMFIGGMAGSTGGGMKTMRIQILLKQARVELHKLVHPSSIYPIRLGRKVIQDDIVANVLAFFLLYALLLMVGVLIMAALGLDHVTSFTSVVACLSNIGPGLGDVGPTDNYASIPSFGKWILSFLMIAGRLEIFTVLVLLTRTYWSK